jgi:hypothetical protein
VEPQNFRDARRDESGDFLGDPIFCRLDSDHAKNRTQKPILAFSNHPLGRRTVYTLHFRDRGMDARHDRQCPDRELASCRPLSPRRTTIAFAVDNGSPASSIVLPHVQRVAIFRFHPGFDHWKHRKLYVNQQQAGRTHCPDDVFVRLPPLRRQGREKRPNRAGAPTRHPVADRIR